MTRCFEIGDRVRVRAAEPAGHCRTPYYLRGKCGVVARRLGEFPNPEELAYHRPGLPAQPLYQVEFAYDEVWGPGREGGGICIAADLYQHWLEADRGAA